MLGYSSGKVLARALVAALATVGILLGSGVATANARLVRTVAVDPVVATAVQPSSPLGAPGESLPATINVTNTGGELSLTGTFDYLGGLFSSSTIRAWQLVFEAQSPDGGWRAIAGAGGAAEGYVPQVAPPISTGLELTATPSWARGVTYPASGDRVVGTRVDGLTLASWDYRASVSQSTSAIADLLDAATTPQVRLRFHAEAARKGLFGSQSTATRSYSASFGRMLRSQSQTASDIRLAVTAGDQPAQQITPVDFPALAALAGGQSAQVQTQLPLPGVAAKSPTETDGEYLARLQTALSDATAVSVNGDFKALGSASSLWYWPLSELDPPFQLGTTRTLSTKGTNITVGRALPVLEIDKTGPPEITPGASASYSITVENTGLASATAVVTDTVEGQEPANVDGFGEIAAGVSKTGVHQLTLPAAIPGDSLSDVATVTWHDRAGNTYGPVSANFTSTVLRDVTPPNAPTLTEQPPSPSGSAGASFSFTGESGGRFTCSLDGGPATDCVSPVAYDSLTDGSHLFSVSQTDDAGNVGSATSYAWTIDSVEPEAPSIGGAPSGSTSSGDANITFAGEPGGSFECQLDGAATLPCQSPVALNALAEGEHSFSIRQTDAAGNTGPFAVATWTVDQTPPQAPHLDSTPPAQTNVATAGFGFTGEPAGRFECKLDAEEYAPCPNPKSYVDVSDGAHVFSVHQIDDAGNVGDPATYEWTVDRVAPEAPVITSAPAATTNQQSATFEFTGEPGAAFTCSLDGQPFEACSSPKSYDALSEDQHTFSLRQADAAGNLSATATAVWQVDSLAPAAPTINTSPASPTTETTATIEFTGEPGGSFECKLDAADWQTCISPATYSNLAGGSHSFSVRQSDATGNTGPESTTLWDVNLVNPPTPLTQNGIEPFTDQIDFLYTGAAPPQQGVAPGTIQDRRSAVVRGHVRTRDNQPLEGVNVEVIGHPEYGHTTTDENGVFSMAVNGGGVIAVAYAKDGYLPAKREADTTWNDYAWVEDTVLVALSGIVTPIDLASPIGPAQVAQGPVETDQDGSRRATLIFNTGTQATMDTPTGTEALPQMNLRATEFTVGANGRDAMPAPLPPTTDYTYAVEYSADEAIAAGATSVSFSRPVITYTDNFLGFPVGEIVPSGYLDPSLGEWVAQDNGRVVAVLSEAGDSAALDVDGSNTPATQSQLNDLGVTEDELRIVADKFAPGESFWRVPINHFSLFDSIYLPLGFDFNWGTVIPSGATAPAKSTGNDKNCDSPKNGSIIGCESQSLGESIPVSGTGLSLNYQTRRSSAFRAERKFGMHVTGSQVLDQLRSVEIQVQIAGQRQTIPIAAAPNKSATIEWDGKDGFGRPVNGSRAAKVAVAYEYQTVYRSALEFGVQDTSSTTVYGVSGRDTRALVKTLDTRLGSFDPAMAGLGGWTLDLEHHYDAETQMLYSGDGTQRSAQSVANTIDSFVKGVMPSPGPGYACPTTGLIGPVPADEAWLCEANDVDHTADGTLMVAEGRLGVATVLPGGVFKRLPGFSMFVSGGSAPYCGQTIPSTLTSPFLREATRVAVDKYDNAYVLDRTACILWKISPTQQITRVTGGGTIVNPPDGTAAASARFASVNDVATGPDGSVYFTDPSARVIRRISPDGLLSVVAGNGQYGYSPDGIDVTQKAVVPYGIAVSDAGTIFFHDFSGRPPGSQIRSISPTGELGTIAGGVNNSYYGCSDAGSPGVTTEIYSPWGALEVTREGDVLFSDCDHGAGSQLKLRKVTPDGTVVDVAGSDVALPGVSGNGDGNPPQRSYITALGATELPNGDIATVGNKQARLIRKKPSALGESAEAVVPSSDGRELYVFDGLGRQVRTLDAMTGALVFEFDRDSEGRITRLIDGDGLTTTITRDADDRPTSIVGPFNRAASIQTQPDGRLASVSDPLGNTTSMQYNSAGLLSTFTRPNGAVSKFAYNADGRLVRDENPIGNASTLSRHDAFVPDTGNPAEQTDVSTATYSTAAGRTTTYETFNDIIGGYKHTTTDPAGNATVKKVRADGSGETLSPDGTVTKSQTGPDPRFGMQAPVTVSASVETPAGKKLSISEQKTAVQTNQSDPLSITSTTDRLTVNGKVSTSVFSRAELRYTDTSPAGRTATTDVDAQSRPTAVAVPGITELGISYDPQGRPISVSQGSRSSAFTYNASGDLASAADALGRITTYDYDAAGRLTAEHLPGGRTIAYSYDENGNVTSITPPSRPAHDFNYDLLDVLTSATAPEAGPASRTTSYEYATPDHDLTKITRPSGAAANLSYDSAGRVSSVTAAEGAAGFTYSPQTGQLTSVTSPDNENLTFTYDGPLLTSQSLTGPVSGETTLSYNNDFLPDSITADGATTNYTYDADSLLTSAGGLTLTRDPQNGLLTGSSLAGITTTRTYNSYAEPASELSTAAGNDLLRSTYTRDALGRITTKQEVTPTKTTTWTYNYDPAGRLENVLKEGNQYAAYSYDANGNKTSQIVEGQATYATFDSQDRMNTFGDLDLTYNANGELTDKRDRTTGDATHFTYSTLGELTGATTEDGRQISYLQDAAGNRVAKQVDGQLSDGFLYAPGMLGPVAQQNATGTTTARFIYAIHANVPDYIVKTGTTYRVVTDQLGSVRMVVDATSGVIAQEIEYGPFGEIIADSNPGFQPFGFAGGLYDSDTRLTHFGAREYDAELGRWTSKDPIGFGGGDSNLYGYVLGDPVNWVDPSGLSIWGDATGTIREVPNSIAQLPDTLEDAWDWSRQQGSNATEYYEDVMTDTNSSWYQKRAATVGREFSSMWTCETATDTMIAIAARGRRGGPGKTPTGPRRPSKDHKKWDGRPKKAPPFRKRPPGHKGPYPEKPR